MEIMIIYIHGASATGESFTHIREHVGGADKVLEYSSANGFYNNLETMKEEIESVDRLFFVAHSLGGIYALHLAEHYRNRVQGGVTLSTPYGGCVQADYAQYFLPFSRLMRDVGTMSKPMTDSTKIPAPRNWTNIVTTVGDSPWIHEPNDGVVTIESMRSKTDMELIEIKLNHYEVVISNRVVELIKERTKQLSPFPSRI
jgi:pimeloyl-ACP methyl ester carboxylesterase